MKVASTSSSMLLGKPLTLDHWLRLRSIDAQAELGEVGHEDVGKSISTAPPRIGLSATIGRAISTESV